MRHSSRSLGGAITLPEWTLKVLPLVGVALIAVSMPSVIRAICRHFDRKAAAEYRRQLAARSRGVEPLTWTTAQERLLLGQGTLIIERLGFNHAFYWWAPDSPELIDSAAGVLVPEYGSAPYPDDSAQLAAAKLIANKYLSAEHGAAVLSSPPPLNATDHRATMEPLVSAGRVRTIECGKDGPVRLLKGDLHELFDRVTAQENPGDTERPA